MILIRWVLLLILFYRLKKIKFQKIKYHNEKANKFLKKSNYQYKTIVQMN